MPVYTYRHVKKGLCPNQPEQDIMQRITEPPVPRCPICSQDIERTVPTGTSFRFKGGAPTPRFGR